MIRVPTRWLARCMVEFGITQGEVTPPLNLFPSFIQTPLVKRTTSSSPSDPPSACLPATIGFAASTSSAKAAPLG